MAAKHATNLISKSQTAMVDAALNEDYDKVLSGHCIYLPHFFSSQDEYTILQQLASEFSLHQDTGMIHWSKHFKHENPLFSPTFKTLIQQMSDYFDVEVYATRLNFYANGTDWKPFHHDSHAYVDGRTREDFTMGASFGASRHLTFLHPPTRKTFQFPQNNGDVFAFTGEANQRFQHGVPRAPGAVGPRFSVIAWGVRRTLNDRNSGKEEREGKAKGGVPLPPAPGPGGSGGGQGYEEESDEKPIAVGVDEVKALVDQFIASEAEKHAKKETAPAKTAQKKSRVQGGWAGGRGRGRGK
uniref:Alpha-ketoglutarate-dependent dioxygenase AlkB-like domain-containing protein n=1 Tax=Arcella intermedia TaxID=1963864 RepID=A0A6B2LB70_9EUKA